MQLIDGQHVFSATDLVGFLACEHLTALELAAAARLVKRPNRPDPELDVMHQRGLAHEARYLADLEAEGRTVTRIEPDATIENWAERLRRAAAETEATIRRGDDVIYQATFFDGRWLGHADFLLRVEKASALGTWSYEIVDTKLARHTKARALLQICSYVDQLARIQEREPEWMYVALGGSARKVEPYRVADYMAYYRVARRRFEEKVAAAIPAYPPVATYPEPVDHCDVCRWDESCRTRRRSDDDLSLVAGIATRQRQALKARGVSTRRGLAGPTADHQHRTLESERQELKDRMRSWMEHARRMEWGGFVLSDSTPRLNTDVRDVADWLRDGEDPSTGLPSRFLQALGPAQLEALNDYVDLAATPVLRWRPDRMALPIDMAQSRDWHTNDDGSMGRDGRLSDDGCFSTRTSAHYTQLNNA